MAPDEIALTLKRGAEFLLLPPAAPLLCVAIGLLWARRRPRVGQAIAWTGLVLALLLSSQWVGQWLISRIELHAGTPLDEAALRALKAGPSPPSAIVILGGGARSDPRERPEVDRPNARTTERLLHGAWVAQVTGLPVLVSGGTIGGRHPAEAVLMKRMLETRLATPVKWVEDRSLDTADNALRSAALLRAAGHQRILLVTHAYHMPRAMAAFERAGLRPIAVPHGFLGTPDASRVLAWLPSAQGAEINWLAAHEGVGQLWYRLRRPLAGLGDDVDRWFDNTLRKFE